MNELTLPEPLDRFEAKMPDGAVIRVRRHGNPAGRRVLLGHGNGFATNAYYPFWRHLGEDCELIVYDQRNHGENPLFGAYGHHVDGFASDLQNVLAAVHSRFGPKPVFGAFHSVSAVAALAHAERWGWRWERLVLFDPPIVPNADEALHAEAFASERFLARWALERDFEFAGPEALADHLQSVRGMQRWVPGAHALMARALVTRRNGRWTLACPRELEAKVYLSNAFAPVWQDLDRLARHRRRLLVLTGDPDLPGSKYPPRVGARLAERFGLTVEALPGTSHMLQLEEPVRAAARTLDFFFR